MKKEMLINVLQPEETRIAILEDGILEELYVERVSNEGYVGNIYKGRIVNIEPSIQAAFVDFGVGRNGFLHISDVDPHYFEGGRGIEALLEGIENDRPRPAAPRPSAPAAESRRPPSEGSRRESEPEGRDDGDRRRRKRRRRGRDRDELPAETDIPRDLVVGAESLPDIDEYEISAEDPALSDVSDMAPPPRPSSPRDRREGRRPAPRSSSPVSPPTRPAPAAPPEAIQPAAEDEGDAFGAGILDEDEADSVPDNSSKASGEEDEPDGFMIQPGAERRTSGEESSDDDENFGSGIFDDESAVEESFAFETESRADEEALFEGGSPLHHEESAFESEESVASAPEESSSQVEPAEPARDQEAFGEAVSSAPAEPRGSGGRGPRKSRNSGRRSAESDAGDAGERGGRRRRRRGGRRRGRAAEGESTAGESPETVAAQASSGYPGDEHTPDHDDLPDPFAVDESDDDASFHEEADDSEEFQEHPSAVDESESDDVMGREEIPHAPPREPWRRPRERARDRDREGAREGERDRRPGRTNGRPMRGGARRPRIRPPIQDIFKRGQEVLVQVIKEGIGNKGPTLSTYISIPGRYLVLMPGLNRVGVSRKILDEEQRLRLRDIVAALVRPRGVGLIVRTAGLERTQKELDRDLAYLARLWEVVVRRIRTQKGPSVIYQESDMIIRTIRDIFTSEIDTIHIDEPSAFQRAKEFLDLVMPKYATRLTLYDEAAPLFHHFGIEDEISRIQERAVPLPQGGSIVIDQTEAMVAIDVNSGNFRADDNAEETAYQINIAAAKEIARQLRLRDLGGVIVNDFIDMREERHRRGVEQALRDAVKRDRARTKVLRMSAFGLIEMTRQRIRPSLKRSLYRECPVCRGTSQIKTVESMAIDCMRLLTFICQRDNVRQVNLSVETEVAAYLLNHKRREVLAIESSRDVVISIIARAMKSPEDVEVICYDNDGNEVHTDVRIAIGERARPRPAGGKRYRMPEVN